MTKVLIVIDDDFRFAPPAAPGANDFTFVTLVNALLAGGYDVTKANRSPDATATMGFENFTFNSLAQLLPFDVIWLIGHGGRNSAPDATSHASQPIPDSELEVIASYMDNGGGVFAVGDHDSIGSVMCGQLPRIRAMRSWYGALDGFARCSGAEAFGTEGHNWTGQGHVPDNYPQLTLPMHGRADTTQAGAHSTYPAGPFSPYHWFENQSDSTPQTITPTPAGPAHPILRSGGADITVYPDHMHEGKTHDVIMGFDYTKSVSFNGSTFTEFPAPVGPPELPKVIATGHSSAIASLSVSGGPNPMAALDPGAGSTDTINILSIYDGRNAGVGRIVTGSTFHHYIDINLAGDSTVTAAETALVGADAQTGHGLGDAPAALASITTVYRNITEWLARPTPVLQLILERSTFSQDEATASPTFDHAILVTVDGLKASQFPGGGIPSLGAVPAGPTPAWAPQVAAPNPSVIGIQLVSVDSDDHTLSPILHRFTFTYRLTFLDLATAFNIAGPTLVPVTATLNSPATAAPLTDLANIELIKSANPFMLDLDQGNTTAWLSSDVKVFPVVAGGLPKLGHSLAAGATRADALNFLQTMLGGLSIADFEGLDPDEEGSALSPLATTIGTPTLNVYNFALARVRVAQHAAPADVRVGFRIVPAPTTASLTFQTMGTTPIGSYMQTAAADPIPVAGQDGSGSSWLSFPCFASTRVPPPGTQTDIHNLRTLPINMGGEQSFFYGALIDNNLTDIDYLPSTPTAGDGPFNLPTLLMGEHQCLVAQVMYSGAPIPNGANPATSDKLSQRNLAFSTVANPGLDASRLAFHTFEIEATPTNSLGFRPDELLLQWLEEPPARTSVEIYIPTWNAQDVVDLADRLYPRHEITVVDAQTISIPGGGTRYVPIPASAQRQTGVISAQFPLGVVKGLRFDLSVRQVTTRRGVVDIAPPKTTKITQAEAARLIERLKLPAATKGKGSKPPLGVFDIGDNRTVITNLRAVDDSGDHALLVEHVPPEKLAAAQRKAGVWRETIGAFQLAVPVSDKASMLPYHLRILSVLRWRAEHLPQRGGRWTKTFLRYVEMMAEKVRALGGDPYAVPPTPDGTWPGLYHTDDRDDCDDDGRLVAAERGVQVGKIASLLYDHFGDFDGFVLETVEGRLRRYLSHEEKIEHLAREAWIDRYVVTVLAEAGDPAEVRELAFGRPG
jgi:hypothetical protein